MLRKHFDKKNRNEYGLSMIELLVVIVIIGILAATAIGVTLNQRKKANDSAVESDVRNVVMVIETALVDDPNATTVSGEAESGEDLALTVGSTGLDIDSVSLSNGVSIDVSGNPTSETGYTVVGNHDNGSKENFTYTSGNGTFKWVPHPTTPPPGGGGSGD